MGLFSKMFKSSEPGKPVGELASRLNLELSALEKTPIAYRELRIPKRSGGERKLLAPEAPLKALQRTILRRVLGKLAVHPAAMGFERGQSIATHARVHLGAAVVIKMDLRDFFTMTASKRIRDYFVHIGWSGPAADLLEKFTTHKSGLPQGAPTSPRLSNLVNYRLDSYLFAAGVAHGAKYTRYADDLTFSLAADDRAKVAQIIQATQNVVEKFGYHLHTQKKLRILRRHDRIQITGLVVNSVLNLPRETRRRLRAVRHHLATNRPATLSETQLNGWAALEAMVVAQRHT